MEKKKRRKVNRKLVRMVSGIGKICLQSLGSGCGQKFKWTPTPKYDVELIRIIYRYSLTRTHTQRQWVSPLFYQHFAGNLFCLAK